MTLVEKYAFDSGRSCVKYFKDGSKILTGGVVGDIFVFGGIEETIDDEDFEPFNIGMHHHGYDKGVSDLETCIGFWKIKFSQLIESAK